MRAEVTAPSTPSRWSVASTFGRMAGAPPTRCRTRPSPRNVSAGMREIASAPRRASRAGGGRARRGRAGAPLPCLEMSVVRPEFGPTLPELLGPRVPALPRPARLALAAAGLGIVLLAGWLLMRPQG